ncbi:unnamed protein product [Moneuplotes crassus]|uniref:Uncharacterized protein n=1 Tax=Euplotes crassus TaxID=5936 RepID=A0AAD2D844_EUPCR|nr:unnamed protein product [Moneuplotes crassus]
MKDYKDLQKSTSTLKIINLVLLVLDLVLVLLPFRGGDGAFEELFVFHLIFLIPSAVYQLSSSDFRSNHTFRLFSAVISILVIGVSAYIYVLLLQSDGASIFLLYYMILLFVGLPGTLISISLLLLLAFGVEAPRMITAAQIPGNLGTPMVYDFESNLKFSPEPKDCDSSLS